MKKFVIGLEQMLGIDLEYLAKNGVFTIAGQLVGVVCGFILNTVFANWLERSTLGQYQYLMAILGFLTVITLPGMNTALIRGAAKNLNGIYFNGVNRVFRFAVMIMLGVVIFAGITISRGDLFLGAAIIVLGSLFPFYSVVTSWRAYLTGKEDFKTLNLVGSTALVVQIAVQSLIVFLWPNYLLLFAAYMLVNLAINGPISIRLYRETRKQPIDWDDIKYARQLSLALVFSTTAALIDRLIVGQALGFEKLAVFSIAVLVPEQFKQMYVSLLLLHYPKLFKVRDVGLAKRQLLRLLMITTAATVGLICLYVLVSPLVFKVIFSKYLEALPISQVLMVTALFTPMVLLEVFLRSQRNTRDVFTYNILGNTLAIIASLIFIPIYGLWGVVISRFVSLVISNLFLFFRFSIRLPKILVSS